MDSLNSWDQAVSGQDLVDSELVTDYLIAGKNDRLVEMQPSTVSVPSFVEIVIRQTSNADGLWRCGHTPETFQNFLWVGYPRNWLQMLTPFGGSLHEMFSRFVILDRNLWRPFSIWSRPYCLRHIFYRIISLKRIGKSTLCNAVDSISKGILWILLKNENERERSVTCVYVWTVYMIVLLHILAAALKQTYAIIP